MFGYSKFDVMFGRKTLDAVRLPYADIAKRGVRVVRETITSIDADARRVTTDAGVHEADVLVVALGADYDMEATPGLRVRRGRVLFRRGRGAARGRAPRVPGRARDRRRLRGAVQVPAGAERGRALAARSSLGAGRPWRMRDLDRDSVRDSGASVARHIGGTGRPPSRSVESSSSRAAVSPRWTDRRRDARRRQRAPLRPVPGRPQAPRSRRRDRQRHDGGRVRARQPEDTARRGSPASTRSGTSPRSACRRRASSRRAQPASSPRP